VIVKFQKFPRNQGHQISLGQDKTDRSPQSRKGSDYKIREVGLTYFEMTESEFTRDEKRFVTREKSLTWLDADPRAGGTVPADRERSKAGVRGW